MAIITPLLPLGRNRKPKGGWRERQRLRRSGFGAALVGVCVLAAFFVLIESALSPMSAASTTLGGAPTVVDADTLDFNGERVRLHGIDAPEEGQTCTGPNGARPDAGRLAEEAMTTLIRGKTVRCEPVTQDRFGRTVARCAADGQDIAAALVEAGWARAYTRYAQDYVPEETRARLAGAGLWRFQCVAPWDHRRSQR